MMVVFMSVEYEKDDRCRNLFMYARDVLNKPYVIVAVGDSYDWQNTHLGFIIGASEVQYNKLSDLRAPT